MDTNQKNVALRVDAWLVEGPHGTSLHFSQFKVGPEAGATWCGLIRADKVAALVEAAKNYMSQIGQGYASHGLPFNYPQEVAHRELVAALAALAGDKCSD